MGHHCEARMLVLFLTTVMAQAYTQQTDTLGGTSQSADGNNSYKLNTFNISTDATLDDIEAYVDPLVNNALMTFVVYEEAGGGQEWTLLWDSGPVSISQGLGFKSSGNVNISLDQGTTYAIGVYLDDDVVYYFEDVADNDLGYALVDGSYWSWNGSTPGGPPNTIWNGDGDFDGHHYHHRITATVPEDVDGDGFNELDDCDDNDPLTYPGAPELCDYIDNDCNGMDDDNVIDIDYFADGDGDGAGDAGDVQTTCDGPPAGYVSNDLDCDDNDGDTHPGAEELCDQTDNDCDGDIDEGLPYSDWFGDADGDGFGDATDVLNTCDEAPPTGYTDNAADCDDTNSTVYPGGEEFCDDIDNDCDGEVDNDVTYRDVFPDVDGDGYGDNGDALSICEPDTPAGYSEIGDDCDDENDTVYPEAEELCDGLDNDCDGEVEADGVDEDGDGSFACEDCEDDDDTIFPGAEDACNGVDNDCDGEIPEAKDCDPNADEALTPSCACNQMAPSSGGMWIALIALFLSRRRAASPG
jgi:hypothetical protein